MPPRSLRILALSGFVGSLVMLRAAAAESAPTSGHPARGLLGQSQVGLSFDWYHLQDAAPFESTGHGYTLAAGFPVASWLDLGLAHSRASVNGPALFPRLTRTETFARATLHGWRWGVAQPFLDLGVGRAEQKIITSEGVTAWKCGVGLEVPAGDSVVFTPRLERFSATGLDDREWRLGLGLDWRFARHWSAGFSATHAAVADDSDYQQYSLRLRCVF